MKTPRPREAARQVVDFVLDYVERTGTFEGRGKKRVLMLNGGVLNMTRGTFTGHMAFMRREVAKLLAGQGTYRKRAKP